MNQPLREQGPFNLVFDADDTLWDSSVHFRAAEAAFVAAFAHSGIELHEQRIMAALRRAELGIIESHGYGRAPYIRALELVVEELAEAELARSRMRAHLEQIARLLLEGPADLLPGVEPTIADLARRHRLLICTKGQVEEQLRRLRHSRLSRWFSWVEVVREKDARAYARLLARARAASGHSFMIGNSPRSDINPALQAGMRAVYIPHPATWELDLEELAQPERVIVLENFSQLSTIF